MKAFRWAVMALLLLALLPMPHNYYLVLRLAVTIYSVLEIFYAYETGRNDLMAMFVVVAILYNPIIKIGFEREVWSFVNVGLAAIIFLKRKELKP
ncbi:MAG: hypothetical protein RMM16_10170 [Chloroherpetonaceae bacterium]|nr:hypothetical protein [Chloroherpetonaceae bacterium]